MANKKKIQIEVSHESTCEFCPYDKDRSLCRKVSFPESGTNCCQCPKCFDLIDLLKKEILRNKVLMVNFAKKENENAFQLIRQDVDLAEYVLKSGDFADMNASYNTLKITITKRRKRNGS